jgi:Tfp pilus assembly protein PilN
MFTIDLLKGQGIPARSRPEGIVATAVTVVLLMTIALTMLAVYLSNRIVINIQRKEIAGYENKIGGLYDEMKAHKKYQTQKSAALQRISETADAIDDHKQWSDILVTIVENLPDSLVLERMSVESKANRVKITDPQNPDAKKDKTVMMRTLNLTLGGSAGEVSNREVQAFRDKLRLSKVLGPQVEDIPVSQRVEMKNDREIITYEMRCILKPHI